MTPMTTRIRPIAQRIGTERSNPRSNKMTPKTIMLKHPLYFALVLKWYPRRARITHRLSACRRGYSSLMSDLEHEIILETQALSSEVAWLSDVAERAVRAAIEAQELAIGRHDGWMDSAL